MSNSYQAVKVVAYSNINWAILQNYTQEYLVKNPQWIAVGQGPDSISSILYSYDSLNWTKGTPTEFDGPINTIANNGSNLWVLGGEDPNPSNRKLKYSSDGTTWNSDTGVVDFAFGANGVIYDSNAKKWFAVGGTDTSTGTIVYSTDPTQGWTTINTGGFTSNIGTGITKGSNIYVATGVSHQRTGTIQNSTDGSNWFNSVSGGFSTLGVYQGNAVATNGSNQWIAVGKAARSTGSILNSSDGLNWSSAVSGGFPVISPAIWVATGVGVDPTSTIKYSLDGLNWSNAVSGGFYSGDGNSIGSGVAFGGSNIWVAVGLSTTPEGSIQYSGNGSNWSNAISGGFGDYFGFTYGLGVAFGNNKWVAVGQSTSILYSSDGKNWNNDVTGAFPSLGRGVAYSQGQNLWVAGGDDSNANGTLRYSGNGINWSNADSGGFDTGTDAYICAGVVGTNSLWVAVGAGSNARTSILNSTNGKDWLPVTTGGFSDASGLNFLGTGVAYNGVNLYVATGVSSNAKGTLQYSGDGSNWSNANSGGFASLNAGRLAYNGSLWIATGSSDTSNDTILYSGDGSNWSNVTSGAFLFATNGIGYSPLGPTAEGKSVAWANNKWIATGLGTGSTTSVLYSGNGLNWSNIPTGGFSNSVGYGTSNINRQSFALGTSVSVPRNTIITSSDGITWSNITSGGFNGFPGSAISYKRWTTSSN